jgi:hypothetical protein
MSPGQFEQIASALEFSTVGAYRWFVFNRTNPDMPGGMASRDVYMRNWFQMNELRGDNLLVSGVTTDPFMKSYDYRDNGADATCRYVWYVSYSILNIVNQNIGFFKDGIGERSLEDQHLLGENYFLRAITYMNLCDLYARPYSHGADNPAVILRTEDIQPALGEATRATIGEVYAQVESDLGEAIRLMGQDYRREANNSFAWLGSAQGLLARLYLYMERNQEAVDMVNEMVDGRALSDVLDNDLATYFTRTQTSRETLWCAGLLANESPEGGGIASMYIAYNGVGWGQHFPSDPMYALFTRYAEDDIRWRDFHSYQGVPQTYQGEPVAYMASWPVKVSDAADYMGYQFRFLAEDEGGRYILYNDQLDLIPPATTAPDETYFTNNGGEKLYIQTETVNTYPRNFIEFKGEKIDVTVTPATNNRNSYRKIFNAKFSFQDGDAMLSSPAFIRWGEVVLNRAEAYAKLGNTAAALADVNAIRTRAGLSGDQLMTEENMGPRGYATALDVVLDERRLELCYEGFRWKDVYRNKRDLDRRYAGTHPYQVVSWDDLRIPHQISEDEIFLNPGVVPNPR